MLALLLALAFADVPPPLGQKRVTYTVEVLGAPADGPQALVVYPWSLSGGAPTAELGVVPPTGALEIGRRVRGSPAFWLIPRDKLPELQGADAGGLAAFFEGPPAVRCGGDVPEVVSEASALAPDVIVHRFALDEVSDRSCVVNRLGPREGIGTGGGPGGCTCAAASSAPVLGLGAWLAVVAARRRRR